MLSNKPYKTAICWLSGEEGTTCTGCGMCGCTDCNQVCVCEYATLLSTSVDNPSADKSFRLGEMVSFQSGDRIKMGTVVAVIRENEDPMEYFKGEAVSITPSRVREFISKYPKGSYVSKYKGGCARGHESYLVLVPQKEGKPQLYWPKVSKLL